MTARGGMTSHAAVVARGMGKCCVSGAGAVHVDLKHRTMTVEGEEFAEGDWLSLNGSTGEVYAGKIDTRDAELSGDFGKLMAITDKYRRLEIRTNADTPEEAKIARAFGATGIGLCRTEHMFFEGERILPMREMILAEDEAGRRKALAKLLPIQRADFEGLFMAMDGHPVTIRLLDPPLHEFVPHDEAGQKEMAAQMGVSSGRIRMRVEDLAEFNPMLGHRGCRLGITYPEITEMQARAILEAALNARAKGAKVKVEIMIPLVGSVREFNLQAAVIRKTAEKVFAEHRETIDYMIGTMIETPRAALVADSIAGQAEFFSFGTNDLTQMTLGFSRDDAGKFLPDYLKAGIYEHDPFRSIDQKGVGILVRDAVAKGKAARPGLETGVCGEHGGDPRLGRLLPPHWPRLRQLLAVPGTDCTACGSTGSAGGVELQRRRTQSCAAIQLSNMFLQEFHRPAPGQVGCRLAVAGFGRVIVEGVVRAIIDKQFVSLARGL